MVPGLSTGAGSTFQGSSSAKNGDIAGGAQHFGPVKFGNMSQGIDVRWLVAVAVVVIALIFAYLMWG